ncbi:MAG: hypothetical protein HZA65_02645 [Rhodocyclales bacterium]|nr:hypothetical protein [Rhodocyclales bacterium]
MRALPLRALACLAALMGGCAGAPWNDPERLAAPAAGAAGSALVFSSSSMNVNGSSSGSAAGGANTVTPTPVSHAALLRQLGGAALIAYALYDPFDPNWRIEVEEAPAYGTARIRMSMRTLTTGGQGEAYTIFRRAAKEIASRRGAANFEIVSYEEGIHSTRPLAQRYAVGDVRLVGLPPEEGR